MKIVDYDDCLHITSFAWIQHSAQCMANSSFAFWNFLDFNIFDPWMVEATDAEL